MYSVLIQNQKTMDSFHEFRPLFLEAISTGRVGTCLWMESGTTIDTVIPEIYDVTGGREEWRAIIVRLEDDGETFPASPANPYDFLDNAVPDARIRENPVPLVRLTQMLGGVPAPQMDFECDMITEENKAPRMVYRPKVNPEDEAAYQALSEKYHFYGRPPEEIILVSLRTRRNVRGEGEKKVWQLSRETDSSAFWKRNGYPSNCRFTFLEMDRQGPVQRDAALFKVWTAVLLLALNEIEPNTLQAYRLHRIDVDFDREKMCATVQECANRTANARRFITRSIQREIQKKVQQQPVLPDYRLEAPVVLKLPRREDCFAKPGAFKLTARTGTSDMEQWREMRTAAEDALESMNTCAERALDQTADRVRHYCRYTDAEVLPLDALQTEDLTGELEKLYSSILDLREQLPCGESADLERLAALEKGVQDTLLERVTTRGAVWGLGIAAGTFALSLLPAAVLYGRQGWGSWQVVLAAVLAGAGVFALAEVLALLMQRNRLRDRLGGFNSFLGAAMTRVSESTSLFSRYMGSIASYTHGSSYLSLMRRKRFLRDEAQFYKQNHLAALNAFQQELKIWSTAFYLPVNFDATEFDEDLAFDTEIPPQENPLYTFEHQASYSVPVNTTGDTVEAPFGFISRLHIVREELYDDAR